MEMESASKDEVSVVSIMCTWIVLQLYKTKDLLIAFPWIRLAINFGLWDWNFWKLHPQIALEHHTEYVHNLKVRNFAWCQDDDDVEPFMYKFHLEFELTIEWFFIECTQVVKALEKSEEMNFRLNQYIDGLLTSIIEKHPELLEIPAAW